MTAQEPNNNQSKRIANLTMATLAAQSGCFTLFIIIVSLLVGLWLDAQFGQRGPFTIGLLLLSIPISLFVMVHVALGAIKNITPPARSGKPPRRIAEQEEDES
jgi:hypothetical protein